jgi:hypothetical protein
MGDATVKGAGDHKGSEDVWSLLGTRWRSYCPVRTIKGKTCHSQRIHCGLPFLNSGNGNYYAST